MAIQTTVNSLGSVSTASVVSSTSYVQRPAKVVGNHKTPLPWNYEILDDVRMNGLDLYLRSNGSTLSSISGPLNISLYQSIPEISAAAKNAVQSKALSRLTKAARGELDLSVSLAEHSQVTRMLGSMGKIESYLKAPLMRDWSKGTSLVRQGLMLQTVLKSMGTSWLTWQYGWRPLIDDFWGIADNLIIPPADKVIKIKGTAKYKYTSSSFKYEYNDTVQIPVIQNGKYGFAYHLLVKPAQANNPLRWASLNPVSIAWELMPYSFVCDWFINVSGYLRNLETAYLNSMNFVSGYTTELHVRKLNSLLYKFPLRKDGTHFITANGYSNYLKFDRKILASWPFPTKPSLNVNLGADQLKSAASLLALGLRGGKLPSRDISHVPGHWEPHPVLQPKPYF